MPATEYYVNQSTSVVFTGGNSIIYLSSSPLLGNILTIRDVSGTTNNTAPITVSTTGGVLFQERESTFKLFQPYSFLTVSPKNISTWNLLNSFGFPQEGSALSVSSFTTDIFDNTIANISSAYISTAQFNTLFAKGSTIVNNGFFSNTTEFMSDIRVFDSMSIQKNLYVASTLFTEKLLRVGSTLNVIGPSYFFNILSTTSTAQIGGNLSTLGNFNLEREALLKSSALFLDHVSIASNLLVANSISTPSNIAVGDSLSVKGNTILTGYLTAQSSVFIGSHLSTQGSFALTQEATLQSSLFVAHAISTTSNLYVKGSATVDGALFFNNHLSVASNLYVQNNISTASNLAVGNNVSVKGYTELTGVLSTQSNVFIGQNLSTFGTFYLLRNAFYQSSALFADNVSTNSNLTVSGLISTLSSVSIGDSLNVRSNTTITGNLSTLSSVYFGNDLTVQRSATFLSSLTVSGHISSFSSIAVAGNLDVAGSVRAGTFELPGNATISTMSIMRGNNFSLINNGSTLLLGYISSTGLADFRHINMSSLFGSTLHITSNISSVGTLDVGGLTSLSNLTVNGTTTFSNSVNVAANQITTLNGAVNITGSGDFTVSRPTKFQGSVNVEGTNILTVNASTVTRSLNVTSNATFSTLITTGDVDFRNIVTARSTFTSDFLITARSISSVNISTGNLVANSLNITTSSNATILATRGSYNTTGTTNYLGVFNNTANANAGVGVFNGTNSIVIGHDSVNGITIPSIQAWSGGTGNNTSITVGATASTFAIQPEGGNLLIGSNAGSVRVGINNTNPIGVLDIIGQSFVAQSTESSNVPLMLKTGTQAGDQAMIFGNYKDVANPTGFESCSYIGAMRINDNENDLILNPRGAGNVAIGLTNPASKLDVNGSLTVRARLIMSTPQGGTASEPSIYWANPDQGGTVPTADSDTGIFHPADGAIGFSANGTERLRVSTVGVFVTGNLTATENVTAYFTTSSDRRLKTDITSIQSALSTVKQLSGVYYTRISTTSRNIGVIAQEVEKVLPEVVLTDSSPEHMKSVAYANLTAILIEAVKELSKRVDDLESRLNQK